MADVMYQPETVAPAQENSENGVVGFGTYFGTTVLFSIPIVGWIASIVMSFVPKRRSLKNYARVMFLWISLQLIAALVIITVLGSVVRQAVIAPLNEQLGTEFGGVIEVIKVSQDLKQGKYSTAFKYFGDQFPEEMQPLVEEMATGEYDELIGMIGEGDYEAAADELENGGHEKLQQIVGEEKYEKAVEELREATEGEKKEWIEKVEKITSFNPTEILSGVLG